MAWASKLQVTNSNPTPAIAETRLVTTVATASNSYLAINLKPTVTGFDARDIDLFIYTDKAITLGWAYTPDQGQFTHDGLSFDDADHALCTVIQTQFTVAATSSYQNVIRSLGELMSFKIVTTTTNTAIVFQLVARSFGGGNQLQVSV